MLGSIEVVYSIADIPRDITALVALGKQYGVGWDHEDVLGSPDHLSDDSRITVRGVGYVCLDALGHDEELRVLFSGNKKALFPQATTDFMASQFPEVPPHWYADPDDGSATTEDSAQRVLYILGDEAHESIALATAGFHARRAGRKFQKTASGLVACIMATDSIVADHSEIDAEYIADWRGSIRIREERV